MTEPASHTLAYLRRLDEKLDRLQGEVGDRFDRIEGRLERVEDRLGRIEDELLVLNGIVLRLEGREMENTGLKAMLDRHERWLGKLGSRVDELEGAPKD
jgi:predicted nuclease with TOPRIM domain